MILSRYLLTQIIKSWASALLVLGLVLMSHAMGYVLGEIAEGSLPEGALWPLMLKESSLTISMLVPISVFLGTVFAFGRLYADHEMAVMRACGVGTRQLIRPVFLVALIAGLFSALFTLYLSPLAGRYAHTIVEQENNLQQVNELRPGQFTLSSDHSKVFYIETISEDQQYFYNVIVHDNSRERAVMEVAEAAFQKTDESSGDLFLVLGPGVRYEGEAGEADFEITHYQQHGILLQQKDRQITAPSIGSMKTSVIMNSPHLLEEIEWKWRLTIPIATFVLTLLALPLSHLSPRRGRFGKTGPAIGLFILYSALISANGAWLTDGSIPLSVGYWWVHGPFVLLLLILLWRRWRGLGG